MMSKRTLIVMPLLFCCFFAWSQNRTIDSLINILPKQKEDSNKVNTLFKLGGQYEYFKSRERVEYFISALNLAKKIRFQNGITRISGQLITNLSHRQLYDVALEYCIDYIYYIKANNLEEEFKKIYKLYATLLSKQGKYKEALEYNFKALDYYLSKNDEVQYATVLSNLCLLHLNNQQPDSANLYGIRAMDLFRKNNKQSEMANSILSLAEIRLVKNDLEAARIKANEAQSVYTKINIKQGVLNTYDILAKIDMAQHKYDSAIVNLNKALEFLKAFLLPEMNRDCYLRLSTCYKQLNDPEKAFENHVKFAAYNDSVSDQRFKAKALEMDAKFNITKKENELKEKEHQIESQNKQRNFLLLGLTGILILLVMSYRGYKQKKKANELITEQKLLVEEKQKEILDSIHYANRIQQALLASDSLLRTNLPEHFVLFKPKDIVSGDFYWATPLKNGAFAIVTADSTGHGVPGAFMSLLNISFLNESINERGLVQPDEILNYTRTRLIKSLAEDGSAEGGKDGMDCILCCYDFKNQKLQYAAANNSFYILRNNELINCAANKMPVGKSPRENEPFTLHEIDLQKGDIVYTLTDGFADQFGGPKCKKFKYKQLESLFLSIHSLSINEQKEKLNQSFENWKGNLEQVDDVLLVGIKI